MGAKMQLRSRSVDDEAFFKRKMRAFYQKIGARRMHELGHGTKEQFASAITAAGFGSSFTHARRSSPSGNTAVSSFAFFIVCRNATMRSVE